MLACSSWLEEGQHKPPIHHQPLTRQECMDAGLQYGFDGGMYAFGKHVYQYSNGNTGYGPYDGAFAFDPELKIMLELLACTLCSHLHWETVGMRHILEKYDEKPPKCVGGTKVSPNPSMLVSIQPMPHIMT